LLVFSLVKILIPKLLSQYKKEAEQILTNYGLNLTKKCINNTNKNWSNLFWTPTTKLNETLLLFDNGFTELKQLTLKGLSKGGVYRRHEEFKNPARKIRLAVLNLSPVDHKSFVDKLGEEIKKYKFDTILAPENLKQESIEGLSSTEAKVKVQTLLEEIIQIPPDVALVFLPQSDRAKDDSDGNSLYAWVSSLLLRRKIARQVIYENTLIAPSRFVFYQVIFGILAKLGNLPFVLYEQLPIADYFIGLDISRRNKKNGNGSINACACIRLYGKQGQFKYYQIADYSLTEGEEIPPRILHDFLPLKTFQNKTVLIYRDGTFRGSEINNLIEWGKAIGAKFILVECAKSQIPRLYDLDFSNKKLKQPTKGLALKLSSSEAIVITTQVEEKIGVPRPLRLKIRQESSVNIDIETLVYITLKLTLLHHGSLKDPRLPIPLFGADKIAYRRLQGIYPGELEGDKQYWL
jgi:argonaute-like protein implicated in RNA metabolism and viral defense